MFSVFDHSPSGNSAGYLMLEAIVGLGLALALASMFLAEQRSMLRNIQQQIEKSSSLSTTKNLEALARITALTGKRNNGDTFLLSDSPAKLSCQYAASSPSESFQFSIQRCQSADRKTTLSLVEPLSPLLLP